MGVFFTKNGDQDVGPGDFLFPGRLYMEDGALDHALEAERRLRIDLLAARNGRRVVVDEGQQLLAQAFDVGGAGTQDFRRGWIVQQRQQQMLDSDELVALLAGLDKRHVQADFKFLGNHLSSSITQASGCWCRREYSLTCSTFVAATSWGYTPQAPLPSRCTLSMT